MFSNMTSPEFWRTFLLNTARVIEVAVLFELLVLLANYWIGRKLAPALGLDAARDPAWRMKRRERLRSTARGLVRAALYTIGVCVVLEVFKAQTTPVYVVLAVVAVVGSVAWAGVLRDMAAGYALLLEDTLAPGDVVALGDLRGTVESVGWRSTRLRLDVGGTHLVCNRELRQFTTTTKRKETSTEAIEAGSGK